MSFFTKNNFLFKLIISLCIVLTLINFVGSNNVYAAAEGSGVGGILINPICDLLMSLGDAIMNIIQNSIMGTDATIVVDNTKETDWGKIILAGIIIAIAVVATIFTAGGATAALAAITPTLVKAVLALGAVTIISGGQSVGVISAVLGETFTSQVVLPTYTIGPEEIFSGKVLLFDANIFNPKQVYVKYKEINLETGEDTGTTGTKTLEEWKKFKTTDEAVSYEAIEYFYESNGGNNDGVDDNNIATSVNNSAYELRDVISKWYYIIRNISLVASMLILLYIGIRMMISSIAEEKAKYTQMLADWVIALCLIVLMHYIMIFAHNLVEGVVKLFDNAFDDKANFAVVQEPSDKLVEGIKKIEESTGKTYLYENDSLLKWPTNQMGRFRVEAQSRDISDGYIGFAIAYLALVLFTLVFSITYIKRLLYLLFLTVIAPFVALTYPIDKLHDGKAQAFDIWFKEYIFNLIIQPFHLLLYTIFVTMAYDLAATNVIYSLVVLGFMIPAEKFLRTMFGFNKASTPGLFDGAAGAALAMSAVKTLGNFAKGGKGGKGGKGSDGKDNGKEDNGKIYKVDKQHSYDNLLKDAALEDELADEKDTLEEWEQEKQNDPEKWEREGHEDAYQDMRREYLEKQEQLRKRREELYGGNQPEPTLREKIADTDFGRKVAQFKDSTKEMVVNSKPIRMVKGARDRIANSRLAQSKLAKTSGKFIRSTAKTGWELAKPALKEMPGTALKFGANAATATTLGAVGLASGIVSGDPSTAFKNTTAAAATGVALSNGLANRTSNTLKNNQDTMNAAKEKWQREYYGEDYDKKMQQKADKEFMKDKEIQKQYKEKLRLNNDEEVKKAMEDAKIYRSYGVTDNSLIIKAMKANNGNAQNRTSTQRIAAAKLASNSKTQKDLDTNIKRLSKVPGMKERQKNDIEKMVREINDL